MSEKNLVPKRRFKEFQNTRAWEQRKLGEMCVIGDIDHWMPDSVSDGIPYIMTGDFIGINGLDFENSKQVSLKDYEQLSKKIKPEQGDILFARYASVGTVRYVETLEKFLISYSCAILKPDETINSKCLFYYLQSDECRQQIELEINTGSQRNIGIDSLKKIKICVPSMKEQSLVSELLTQLDKLITLHQHKLEKTKALKSAYLAEMFPGEGERVPKRRFAGFTGEWEQKRLGDISNSFSGGTPTAGNKLFYGGDIPFIRSGEVNAKNTGLFITEEGLKASSAKLVRRGDILYALYGATSGEVGISQINGAINQAVLAIKPDLGNNTYFITQWLRKQKPFITETYLQGGQGNLSGNIVKQLMIDLPQDKNEQKEIGEFFNKMDKSITNQQQKLDKLKAMKQAYLQEMFV